MLKVHQLKKSTPPPVVAVVTNMSYVYLLSLRIIIKITAILKPCVYLCNVQCVCIKLIPSIIQPIPMLYCIFIWTGRHICSKLRWGPKCFDEKCRVPIYFLMQYHTKTDCADVLVPKLPEAVSHFTRPSNKKAERRRFFPLLKETNTRSVCYHSS